MPGSQTTKKPKVQQAARIVAASPSATKSSSAKSQAALTAHTVTEPQIGGELLGRAVGE